MLKLNDDPSMLNTFFRICSVTIKIRNHETLMKIEKKKKDKEN